MDHFNSEVYGELVSMRELQAKLGLCLRNQEAIHQRLDEIFSGMNGIVDQVNAHKKSWASLSTWIQETSHNIADLERSAEKSEVAMGKAHVCLWKAVGDLQQAEEDRQCDQEIEKRANNV